MFVTTMRRGSANMAWFSLPTNALSTLPHAQILHGGQKMTCKHCGSDRHVSNDCPALHLTKFLLDQEYDESKLPDIVTAIDADDLFRKTEEELHDEVVNIKKLSSVKHIERNVS